MSWRAVFITALIAAALAGYSLLTRREADTLTDQPAPAQPGYYLNDASIIETDATGAPRLKLVANTINQNLADDSITLQQVTLNYQNAADRRWLLTAEQGHLVNGSRAISFTGNVHIRPLAPASSPVSLRTETLNVDTERQTASAPGRVNIEMDHQQLTAVGLKYDLKRQKLQLESQVHGQFNAN